jgi:hypothetical protein
MFARFHKGIMERIRKLEADCENFAFKETPCPMFEKHIDDVTDNLDGWAI